MQFTLLIGCLGIAQELDRQRMAFGEVQKRMLTTLLASLIGSVEAELRLMTDRVRHDELRTKVGLVAIHGS